MTYSLLKITSKKKGRQGMCKKKEEVLMFNKITVDLERQWFVRECMSTACYQSEINCKLFSLYLPIIK